MYIVPRRHVRVCRQPLAAVPPLKLGGDIRCFGCIEHNGYVHLELRIGIFGHIIPNICRYTGLHAFRLLRLILAWFCYGRRHR